MAAQRPPLSQSTTTTELTLTETASYSPNDEGNATATDGQGDSTHSESLRESDSPESNQAQPAEATNDAEKRVEDPWSKLAETVWHRSKDDINRWWEEINSLLTFAGLFSAVVTGFAVLCYTVLADSGATADAPILHHYVAALWFASLVCGLASASIAISVNQWLNYMLTPAGLVEFGPRQKLRIWNLRQLTFKKCHVAFIIGIPPVLLQLALALFLIGLVGFLWTLSIIIALPTLILVALLLAFQLAMLVVPAVLAYSPFQSPQAQWLRWVVFRIVHTIARAVHYAISRHPLAVSKPNAEMPVNPRPKGRFGTDTLTVLIFRLEELCKHSSWVANEKHYLDNVLHSGEIDSELFAATFRTAVTKDDKPTLQYIQQCLRDMPLHLACSNAAALWTESDKARLDNSIRCTNTSESTVTNPSASDTADESRASWHYDTLDKDVTIMMADVLVDVMTRLVHSDPQKLPDHMQPEDVRRQLADMSKKLDILLWLLPAMGGREVYRRILGLLQTSFRAGEHIHLGARYRILDVIWGHVNCFSLKDITGIHTVIKKTHNQEKDYTMKLELITFALHVHVHHHQSTDVGETLTDLDLLLRSMEETDFTRATSRVPSHVPVLIQDLEHQAYSSSQPTRPELLTGIVNTLSKLAHGRKFRLFDRDMLAMKQKDLSDVSHNIHTQFGAAPTRPAHHTNAQDQNQHLGGASDVGSGLDAPLQNMQDRGSGRNPMRHPHVTCCIPQLPGIPLSCYPFASLHNTRGFDVERQAPDQALQSDNVAEAITLVPAHITDMESPVSRRPS